MSVAIPQHGLGIQEVVVKKEGWLLEGHCQAKSRSSHLAQSMAMTLSSRQVIALMAFSHIFHLLSTPILTFIHNRFSHRFSLL
jgi:hypothetical protein